jgi:hypothetical protein
VQIYGENSWHRLCKFMPNKTEIRCFKRWILIKDRNDEPVHVHRNRVLTDAEKGNQLTLGSQWS